MRRHSHPGRPRSRRRWPVRAGLVLTALAVLTGCGGGTTEGIDVDVATDATFPAGTSMARFAKAGTVTIGVKYDQPGIGYLRPGSQTPTGFDVEIGKIVAAGMGIAPEDITWTETVSKNRESYLQQGTVDLVIASYSITDERRKVVGQAGPYYVTGQQLLVRADDSSITGPGDLSGKRVCSVTGSTSLATVQEQYDAKPVPFATYSECVQQLKNGTVDAVTTDGAILLGYAAENPDTLKVVGEPFSTERYGIGYRHGDTALCQYLTDTLKRAIDDGTWRKAFDATLGQSGVKAPEPPTPDPCQ